MVFFVGPLIAFAATVLWVFILRPAAPQLGLLDIPNERSSHEKPTPLVGGLAIFLGLVCGTLAVAANGIVPLDRYTLSLLSVHSTTPGTCRQRSALVPRSSPA